MNLHRAFNTTTHIYDSNTRHNDNWNKSYICKPAQYSLSVSMPMSNLLSENIRHYASII
jgi:hypothetical protein